MSDLTPAVPSDPGCAFHLIEVAKAEAVSECQT